MPDELSELLDACLRDDQSAMAELVRRFQGQVFGLCYRMLGNRQDAEDMAQESFVRALRSLANFDRQRAIEPWLLAIAGNRCRTLLANRRRRPETGSISADVPAPESEDHAKSLSEEVTLGLSSVRSEYRQAFLMFHEHEMSYVDIASALECPLGTVKTWIHRARRELIDHLRSRGIVAESNHAVRSL